jgi:chromosome segregation ATPase
MTEQSAGVKQNCFVYEHPVHSAMKTTVESNLDKTVLLSPSHSQSILDEFAHAKMQIKYYRELAEQKDKELESKDIEAASLKAQLSLARNDSTLVSSVNVLKEELSKERIRSEELIAQLQSVTDTLQRSVGELQRSDLERDSMNYRMKELIDDLASMTVERDMLKAEVQEHEEIRDEQQKHIVEYMTRLDAEISKNQDLRSMNNSLRNSESTWRDKYVYASEESERAVSALRDLRGALRLLLGAK